LREDERSTKWMFNLCLCVYRHSGLTGDRCKTAEVFNHYGISADNIKQVPYEFGRGRLFSFLLLINWIMLV
jgi:hypothetical protein